MFNAVTESLRPMAAELNHRLDGIIQLQKETNALLATLVDQGTTVRPTQARKKTS